MFRLYFAYMSPYQVLEYHMEFLETFGCIWSSKEVFKVIIGRAAHGSDLTGATPATSLERRPEVARYFASWRHEIGAGATSRSDPSRSLPKPRATCWSDEPRSLHVSYLLELMIFQGPFAIGGRLSFVLKKTTKNLWNVHLFESIDHFVIAILCFHIYFLLFRIVSKLKVDSLIDRLPSLVRNLITQGLIPMPMSSLFP
ncbi:hypothetical protein IGI04_002941 [Brassica rapa subsp. trilocularis]|uniref:Uncharacterized protein n=1 Tax=Brassica rapa subsp. trilocularis TaxID=1813537 RepID=A0ABQ7NX05_BRACM|nr:hypothetical protein IGI04_002941 [Brassica rapa subsp. trilocularis]